MLELNDVTCTRGEFTLRANWKITAGQRVAITGPSGGGKSSLLDVIAGFLTPTTGIVRIDGRDQTGVPPGARPVSLLFQDNNLFAHLSVFDNVALGLSPVLKQARKEAALIEAALAETGLQGMSARLPSELSGGQRQRAALARTLLRHRPVLALDEPFAALGPALRHEMLALVKDLAARHDMTVLMVTHAPEDVRALGGEVVFVEAGFAHPPVPAAEALADPSPGLRNYLGLE